LKRDLLYEIVVAGVYEDERLEPLQSYPLPENGAMTPESPHGDQTKRKPCRSCRHACEHIAQVMNAEVKAAEADQHDQ
jgi:hypothetical protein